MRTQPKIVTSAVTCVLLAALPAYADVLDLRKQDAGKKLERFLDSLAQGNEGGARPTAEERELHCLDQRHGGKC